MKVRIGIADSTKVVELEVDNALEFEASLAEAVAGDEAMVWLDDAKKRRVGVPVARLAYVEIETDDARQNIGFGPSS